MANRLSQMMHEMLPDTPRRVPEHTSTEINQEIRQCMQKNIENYAAHPELIDQRLRELDQEWDIERALEAQAATVSLTGLLLGATVSKKFFILPAIVGGFLLQHAMQGWCPPVPFMRRLGFRTEREIDQERYALKALRGDFRGVPGNGSGERVNQAMRAVEE